MINNFSAPTPNPKRIVQTPLDEQSKLGENVESHGQLIKPLEPKIESRMPQQKKFATILMITAIAAGIGTGYGAYRLQARGIPGVSQKKPLQQVAGENIQIGDVFGSADTKTFKDSAQGYLQSGGLDGEGSHSLLRAGGESQTVYLTSSVTDLEKLVGMEVKVWGETFKGQKAGWLMDVGRIEVINTQAEAPSEE